MKNLVIKKAVIFDMDGVIIDSEQVYVNQIKEMMIQRNKDVSDAYVHSFVGVSNLDMEVLLDEVLLPEDSGTAFMKALYEQNEEIPLNYKEIVVEGVYEVLEHFKSNGYAIALASSSSLEKIHEVLDTLELTSYFDAITSGYEFKQSKPHPEIYEVTLSKLNVDAKDAFAIEDSFYGIASAKAAGITTAALKDTRFGINQQQADYQLNQLMDCIAILRNMEQ